MRVIAGSARHLLLKTIDGLDTRPTTDRIKETLFNILNPQLPGCCFLDLFSGSGGIGIEALSRGAQAAVFIEHNPKAATCIRENLAATRLEDRGLVMNCDVAAGLSRLEGKGYAFDLVFMDPPYHLKLEETVLRHLARSKLLASQASIILEAARETDFPYLESLGFSIKRCKEYKTNKHVFIQLTEEARDDKSRISGQF